MANPIGKKVLQKAAAVTAQAGTDWEDLLTWPETPALRVATTPSQPWVLSCPDWESRLLAGRSLVPALPLFDAEAERGVGVFDKLRLHDVIGTPTCGEVGGPWFREIVRVLFGSLDPQSRQRMVRELFILVPKKNNKTTGGALLMLTALILNRRPKAQFFFVAPVRDTANIAFAAASGAINLDPVLQKKLHIREHLHKIVHRETGAELQIMTFDPATLTGQKTAGVLIDELHETAKKARASSAILQLRGGMLPFPEAFMVFITTQSEEAPAGIFKDELLKAREIRDGKRAGAMMPVLYEFPRAMQAKADAWRNPLNWPLVTPNAGRSVQLSRLVEEFDVAQSTSEGNLREWASQHLNVEIGLALHSDRWVGADYWEKQARPRFTLDELIARSEVIEIGYDGGGLDDLLGLNVLGRDSKTREWLSWTHAWVHEKVLQLRKSEAARFKDFARDGDLTIVQGYGEDIAELASLVAHVQASGKLDRIGMDAHGLGGIVEALALAGIEPKTIGPDGKEYDKIMAIPQGWRMNGHIMTAERKLAEGGLIHGGQPLMAWCVSNAKVEAHGNAVSITKKTAGTGKIDPLIALLNAVSLLALNPAAPGRAEPQLLFV